jgi:hypothetical protein
MGRPPPLSGFFLQRIAGVNPGIEAALEGIDVLEAVVPEYLRRPGARGFLVSGAIGDNEAVAGYLVEVRHQFAVVDAPGPRYHYIRRPPVVHVPGIDKENRLAGVKSFPDLGQADSF